MSDRNQEFATAMEPAARVLWGEPNKAMSKPGSLRWGKGGSKSVDTKAGTYFDHEAGVGGGVMKLIEMETGLKGREAIEWLEANAGAKISDDRPATTRRKNGSDAPDDDRFPPPSEASAKKAEGKKKIVATYDYTDGEGGLLYQVVRFEPKGFAQRRPDPKKNGQWIWNLEGLGHGLYRLPDLREALAAKETVFLAEGEKDADNLWKIGIAATTNSGGAKHWADHHAEMFRGCDVVIPVDNDKAGRDRGQAVAKSLHGVAKRVRVLDVSEIVPWLPEKGDISDWIEEGATAEAIFEAVAKLPAWQPVRESRFGRVSWSQLDDRGPEIDYIIDDWLTKGDKSILAGPSGSGKSFLAIDAGLSIALGRPWFGNETKPGLVVYQAGEGGRGVKRRLRAFRKHFNIDANASVPFELLTSKIDIFAADDAGGDTKQFIEAIQAIKSEWPDMPLQAVFIDTLSVAQGGADEISGKDMIAVLNNIDKISAATGAHVCLVHHMNAEGKKLRGHTSLKGNVDQVILVTRNEQTSVRTVVLDKMKDGEDGLRLQFELLAVDVGVREDAKRITSCVCLPLGEKEAIRKEEQTKGITLNTAEITLMKAFFATDNRYGRPVPEDMQIPSGVRTIVEWNQVLRTYAEANPIDEDLSSATEEEAAKAKAKHKARHDKRVTRCRQWLQNNGIIGISAPYAWWTGKPLRAFPHTQPKPSVEEMQQTLSPELQELARGPDIPFL